jgi:hypothetical protein
VTSSRSGEGGGAPVGASGAQRELTLCGTCRPVRVGKPVVFPLGRSSRGTVPLATGLAYWSRHQDSLEAIIAHVLVHEIGHHFGFSDEDMQGIEDGGLTEPGRRIASLDLAALLVQARTRRRKHAWQSGPVANGS